MASCKLSGPVFQKAGSLSRCIDLLSFPTALTSSYTLTSFPRPPAPPTHVSPAGHYRETVTTCSCGKLINVHPLVPKMGGLPPNHVDMETKLRYIINPARRHHRQCRPKDNFSHSALNSGMEHCGRMTLETPPIFTNLLTTSHVTSHVPHVVGGAGHVTSRVTSKLPSSSLYGGDVLRGGVVSCARDTQPVSPQQQQQHLSRGQGEKLPSPAQLSFILLKLREEVCSSRAISILY